MSSGLDAGPAVSVRSDSLNAVMNQLASAHGGGQSRLSDGFGPSVGPTMSGAREGSAGRSGSRPPGASAYDSLAAGAAECVDQSTQ